MPPPEPQRKGGAMIIVRRLFAVILALLLIVVLLATLTASGVNGSLGSAAFHKKQLAEGDVYNFVYGEVAPLAIKEAGEDAKDARIDITKLDKEIIGAARAAFPPEFLQQQTERALDEFVPYITNKRDTFTITIPIAEQLRAAGPGIKQAISTGRLPDVLYEDIARDRIDDALRDARIPFGLRYTSGEVLERARRIAPPDFVQAQINNGIDALLPYLAGDTERFTVTVDVASRRDVAAAELKALVLTRDTQLQDFVLKEVVDPMAQREIGGGLRVPFNLTVTTPDVQQALRETVGGPWLQARIADVVTAAVDYATTRSQTFSVTIPLADRKPVATEVVGRLMDQKLAQAYAAARPCTPAELAALTPQALLDRGIVCRPAGVSLDQVKALAGIVSYQAEVARIVSAALPGAYVFAEADLRGAFGASQSNELDELRKWFREGVTYTERDLEEDLAKQDYDDQRLGRWDDLSPAQKQEFIRRSGNVADLHDFRQRIRKGFTYDQEDLLEDIRDQDGEEGVRDFEDARDAIGLVLSAGWWGWLIVAALVTGIGALGGRRWRSRIAWGAGALAVAALLMYTGFGLVTSDMAHNEAQQQLEEELADPEHTELERAVLLRAQTITLNAIDDGFSGVATKALVLLIVSIVVLVVMILWPQIERWRGKGRAPPAPA